MASRPKSMPTNRRTATESYSASSTAGSCDSSFVDSCGLSFDPACLQFHQTSCTELSLPSAAQVREPLRSDTARSKRSGDRLDRLRDYLRGARGSPGGMREHSCRCRSTAR